ncbi:pentatricopeptide repeat-containing protein At5g27110 [Aristolochia californica]|uniref:pentatricopeptide repeat-containing protein At5g27110 n=1 Tax=Aristolochia californica TaxID=171875 RepID=UPI0035E1145A
MDAQKLVFFIRSCIASKSLKKGKLVHQKIISLGLQNNIFLCKNIINFYIAFHLFKSARLVFQTIENPLDMSLWNGLLAAYSKNDLYDESLRLFERLQTFPYLKPDSYTYPSVIKACGGLGKNRDGRKIHAQVVKLGIGLDVVVTSSLVGMYAKCNLFEPAIQLFKEMPERDVACWNTVISCYYQDGQPKRALEMFGKMKNDGFEPDSVTFTTVFSACARLLDLKKGREIHKDLMRSGFQLDDFVSSAIVDMYGRCGCLEMAREVFEHIPRKSVVCWNSMIGGYASNADSHSCLELFVRMNKDGVKPTTTTLSSLLIACSRSANLLLGELIHGYIIRNHIGTDIYIDCSLIDLYFKCGSVSSACSVFQKMPKTNTVSWNVMISGYSTVGSYFDALNLFSEMRNTGVIPDAVTLTSILPVCSQLGALEKGKEIQDYIIENKFETNEIVMSALLDMYAKCGSVDDAREVFNRLPIRDFVSWTSMITAYGSHGEAKKALELFQEMQNSGAKPDGVTFLAVMTACSHAGLVDEGCSYFNQMINIYGLEPKLEHYSCLVDLLARAGRLNEAYSTIQSNSAICADVGLLSSLLSACSLHGNLELGEKVGELLIEKDPDDSSTYIILSNMYASAKNWDEVGELRAKMKKRRLMKNPGCSWVEVDMRIHPFFVQDKSHPEAEQIYECLWSIVKQMEMDDKDNPNMYHELLQLHQSG